MAEPDGERPQKDKKDKDKDRNGAKRGKIKERKA